MSVRRIDPDRIVVLGGKPGDKERFLKHDALIRSGMCPNGHGPLETEDGLQYCQACNFVTNRLAG